MEKYILYEMIGEGSFGTVYRARRKYSGEIVAIKVIRKSRQTLEEEASFRREIDILSKIHHPNIMQFLDVFETETDFCVVSEFGRGDLYQIIIDKKPTLEEEEIKKIAIQLLSALINLHNQRIIHRDLKPENILITNNGTIKICDFGFARALSSSMSVVASTKGTPLYMAPEIFKGIMTTDKVDIWAFGVILYELFHGFPPFQGQLHSLIDAICNNGISFPNPISDDFRSFIELTLQKEPEARPTSQELLKHPFLSGMNPKDFINDYYQFKNEEFIEAIHDPDFEKNLNFDIRKQLCTDGSEMDPQMILNAPLKFEPSQVITVLSKITPKSPNLIECFIEHFPDCINSQSKDLQEEAIKVALLLIKQNPQSYSSQFKFALIFLSNSTFSDNTVEFFTHLITIPFTDTIEKNTKEHFYFNGNSFKISYEQSVHLRDRLLSLLYQPNSYLTYSLIEVLAMQIPSFLTALSGEFSAQLIPILSSATLNSNSSIKAASYSILTICLGRNNKIEFIQPLLPFLNALKTALISPITDFNHFCVFSSALNFFAVFSALIHKNHQFQITFEMTSDSDQELHIFLQKIMIDKISALIQFSQYSPISSYYNKSQECISEILAESALIASPFFHVDRILQLDLKDFDKIFLTPIIPHFMKLLPLHQYNLIQSLSKMNIPSSILITHISQIIKFLSEPSIHNDIRLIDKIALVIGNSFDIKSSNNFDYLHVILQNHILLVLTNLISELLQKTPKSINYLLKTIFDEVPKGDKYLDYDEVDQVIDKLYNGTNTLQISLHISSKLAKISTIENDFVSILVKHSVFELAMKGLQQGSPIVKGHSAILIGNLCKVKKLPRNSYQMMQELLNCLSISLPKCQKYATYAIKMAFSQDMSYSEQIVEKIDDLLVIFKGEDIESSILSAKIIFYLIKTGNKSIISKIRSSRALDILKIVAQSSEYESKIQQYAKQLLSVLK